ncbi:sigma factor-like helix-turn-helix DNA-binding protein [Streptomyces sp. NPDC048717]|uniref:sigma factor-like helix-turn-helix DNA-binding protein n=1 Tax=Streptomyces sp. NPDC048717 TaxID=3154928 RepID=UPI0034429E2A
MNPTPPPVVLPSPKERRRLREALALSEEQVARALGVTRATVRAWEAGRASPKGRQRREAYARLLGVYEEPAAPAVTEPSKANSAAVKAPKERLKPAGAGAGAEPKPEPESEPESGSGSGSGSAPTRATGALGEPVPAAAQAPSGPTPQDAFDALYAHASPGLLHQAYLLTARRRLAREAVAHAFRHAWRYWPEVACDPDPVGWVRAAAHDHALSPWHRFRLRHRRPDTPPADPALRELLAALQALPPSYRRTLLLYDGLGLDLPDTAAETEASTPAAGNRLLHARAVIGRRIPGLADPEALHQWLAALVADVPAAPDVPAPPAEPPKGASDKGPDKETDKETEPDAESVTGTGTATATATGEGAGTGPDGTPEAPEATETPGTPAAGLPAARSVRGLSERGARRTTRLVFGVTASLIAVTAFTAATAPDHYIPAIAPGEAVGGVPALGGPPKLRPEDKQLRDKLRHAPHPGPERLIPRAE